MHRSLEQIKQKTAERNALDASIKAQAEAARQLAAGSGTS
jgi:hypothetical protein